jgi:hypothetical protein
MKIHGQIAHVRELPRLCARHRAQLHGMPRPHGSFLREPRGDGRGLFGLVPHTYDANHPADRRLFAATLLMSMKQSAGIWSLNNFILYYFGAKSSSVLSGQWWRLVRRQFLHGGTAYSYELLGAV